LVALPQNPAVSELVRDAHYMAWATLTPYSTHRLELSACLPYFALDFY
jgi:hypothetical protein